MATKLINKNKLVFKNGFFYKKNKRVYIESNVVEQLNKLETLMQQYDYLDKQGEYNPEPSLEGFEREHIETVNVNISSPTPILDEEIEKTKAMLEEIDNHNTAKEVERVCGCFKDLLYWVASEEVLITDESLWFDEDMAKVDTPHIGNPLKLDQDSLMNVITFMVSDGENLAYVIDHD